VANSVATCITADVFTADATFDVPTDGPSPDAFDSGPFDTAPSTDVSDAGADATMTNDDIVDVLAIDAIDTTDAAGDVSADAAPSCGGAGESCCYGSFCNSGLECNGSSVCQPITRAANECTRSADCTSGQACGGPMTCTDHGCFQCEAPPGTAAFGGACTTAADCATGVCRGQHCTIACDLGGTGDADCNAAAAGYICAQVLYRSGTAPMTTIVALGTCRLGCLRNGDCTAAGESCIPQLNDATNTLDFICGVSSGTSTAGQPCSSGTDCQSYLCVPGYGDGGTGGVCTAPCGSDADCPSAAPHCTAITWARPDGSAQPGHGCLP
jgi:hypothetical protein